LGTYATTVDGKSSHKWVGIYWWNI